MHHNKNDVILKYNFIFGNNNREQNFSYAK